MNSARRWDIRMWLWGDVDSARQDAQEGTGTVKALRTTQLRLMAASLAALLLWAGGASAQEAAAIEPPEPSEKTDWIDGRLDIGLDARRTDSDSDFELEQYLNLEITPPKYEKLSIRGSLWTIEDVDGREPATSTLRNLNDASSGSVRARLLYLYVEVDDLWGDSTLRVGRQRILDSPIFNRIDGIYFKKRTSAWDWYAFGGARASVYNDVHNDHVLGGGVAFKGLPKTRISLDAFYGEEHRDEVRGSFVSELLNTGYPRRVKSYEDDRQIALSIAHQVNPKNSIFGRYTWHDSDSDELELSATGVFSARDVVYDLRFRKRLEVLEDRTSNTTGFYRVLGGQDEYTDLRGSLHIPLGDRYAVAFQAQWHDTNGSTERANRDYDRFGIVLSGTDLGPGIDAQIAVERWDVSGGEGTWAVTGELSKAWERFELSGGADFERYEDRLRRYNAAPQGINYLLHFISPRTFPRYNPLVEFLDVQTVEYHENIYSFFVRADYELSEKQSLWAEITFEEDDGPDSPYWRLQAEYSIRF